jgi:hypothetical protein
MQADATWPLIAGHGSENKQANKQTITHLEIIAEQPISTKGPLDHDDGVARGH